jgi:hypothetical protein
VSQWYLMSIAFVLFCLRVSFKIPKAVELSVHSGVAGCVWPNSVSVTLIGAHARLGVHDIALRSKDM